MKSALNSSVIKDEELNVNRAVTEAKKTNFHLYTHFFNLPLTARCESKFVEVVHGSTTAFTLECFHYCACT